MVISSLVKRLILFVESDAFEWRDLKRSLMPRLHKNSARAAGISGMAGSSYSLLVLFFASCESAFQLLHQNSRLSMRQSAHLITTKRCVPPTNESSQSQLIMASWKGQKPPSMHSKRLSVGAMSEVGRRFMSSELKKLTTKAISSWATQKQSIQAQIS